MMKLQNSAQTGMGVLEDSGQDLLVTLKFNHGPVNQADRDLLAYVSTKLADGIRQGQIEPQTRSIQFSVRDFLGDSREIPSGKSILCSLWRLQGTRIQLKAREKHRRLLDSWRAVEGQPCKPEVFEVTLSEWLIMPSR